MEGFSTKVHDFLLVLQSSVRQPRSPLGFIPAVLSSSVTNPAALASLCADWPTLTATLLLSSSCHLAHSTKSKQIKVEEKPNAAELGRRANQPVL